MSAAAQLAALAQLDDRLHAEEIAYWLFGGWAVDFHVGRITRAHDDLDIAVWWHDRDRVAALLATHEWVHRPEPDEDGYTCYERDGIRLEMAFVARDEHGRVYTPLMHRRAEWPSGAFGDDVCHLLGVRARALTREALITDKSVARDDPVTDAKDRLDVLSLGRDS